MVHTFTSSSIYFVGAHSVSAGCVSNFWKDARIMPLRFIPQGLFLCHHKVMSYVHYQPNPCGRLVGDCAVRALCKALGVTWEQAYLKIVTAGYGMCDMPSSNSVILAVLRQNGFESIPRDISCPDCFTVKDFCADHPKGTYVIFTSGHVLSAIDGNYWDAWDSGQEIMLFAWKKIK